MRALHGPGIAVILALVGGTAGAEPFNDRSFDWTQAELPQPGLTTLRPPARPVPKPAMGFNDRNGDWVAAVGTERQPQRHPGKPIPPGCLSGQEPGFNDRQTVINLCD